MVIYRFYVKDGDTISDVSIGVWSSDEEAIEEATGWARGREVEVWEGDRLVMKIAASE